ncbi:MAG: type II toxin-antitoxin system Phd/YefM family antitoxin [Rhodospirillaceae bacterium]
MTKVSSAEFQRQFGLYRDAAQRAPVTITNHGRETLVLLSADEYQRLKALDLSGSYYAEELPDALKDAIDKAEPPEWTEKFNDEMS